MNVIMRGLPVAAWCSLLAISIAFAQEPATDVSDRNVKDLRGAFADPREPAKPIFTIMLKDGKYVVDAGSKGLRSMTVTQEGLTFVESDRDPKVWRVGYDAQDKEYFTECLGRPGPDGALPGKIESHRKVIRVDAPANSEGLTNTEKATTPEAFIRRVVESLLNDRHPVTFDVADKVFAIDNGEAISREQFSKEWPEIGKTAFKKTIPLEQFFREVDIHVSSPLDNKRLMSNKKVMEAYKYQEGDLCCDASHVKDSAENFIGYSKAFVFIIRKTNGAWTLIGIGG